MGYLPLGWQARIEILGAEVAKRFIATKEIAEEFGCKSVGIGFQNF